MRLRHKVVAIGQIAADHDRIRVESLRQLERTGSRGLKALRQAEMIERVEAVCAAERCKARGVEAAGKNLGGGFADPLDVWLAAAVVEWQHQQDAAGTRVGRRGSGWRGRGLCGDDRRDEQCEDEKRRSREST